MEFSIGDRKFPSKKAAREWFIKEGLACVARVPPRKAESWTDFDCCTGIEADARFASIINDLSARHPNLEEKVGAGILRWGVMPDQGSIKLYLIRVDETVTMFSWNKCFTRWSHKSEVRVALRQEAYAWCGGRKEEILARQGGVCAISGEALEYQDCDIDHTAPWTHINLCDAFLATNGLEYSDVELERLEPYGTRLADRTLADLWFAYHATHARLRAIHRTIHWTLR